MAVAKNSGATASATAVENFIRVSPQIAKQEETLSYPCRGDHKGRDSRLPYRMGSLASACRSWPRPARATRISTRVHEDFPASRECRKVTGTERAGRTP